MDGAAGRRLQSRVSRGCAATVLACVVLDAILSPLTFVRLFPLLMLDNK